jgi:hypothetical protein
VEPLTLKIRSFTNFRIDTKNNTSTHTKVSTGDTLAQVYCLCTKQAAQIVITCRQGYGPLSNKLVPQPEPTQPPVYQIRIKGQLDSQWSDWFSGMTITLENGDTLLTGPVVDQAALHGLLKKIRDLGLPLVSVCPIEPGQADKSNVNS